MSATDFAVGMSACVLEDVWRAASWSASTDRMWGDKGSKTLGTAEFRQYPHRRRCRRRSAKIGALALIFAVFWRRKYRRRDMSERARAPSQHHPRPKIPNCLAKNPKCGGLASLKRAGIGRRLLTLSPAGCTSPSTLHMTWTFHSCTTYFTTAYNIAERALPPSASFRMWLVVCPAAAIPRAEGTKATTIGLAVCLRGASEAETSY